MAVAADAVTPRLRISLAKRADGAAVLRLVRADGTSTWQRHEGRTAVFFPLHDLTHFAVETAFAHGRGFYGLVADGWEVGDFGSPWPRGPLPADADPSELIVGYLDLERATGHEGEAASYDAQLRARLATSKAFRYAPVTPDGLARARATMRELHARWLALPAGETMELAFDVGAA